MPSGIIWDNVLHDVDVKLGILPVWNRTEKAVTVLTKVVTIAREEALVTVVTLVTIVTKVPDIETTSIIKRDRAGFSRGNKQVDIAGHSALNNNLPLHNPGGAQDHQP